MKFPKTFEKLNGSDFSPGNFDWLSFSLKRYVNGPTGSTINLYSFAGIVGIPIDTTIKNCHVNAEMISNTNVILNGIAGNGSNIDIINLYMNADELINEKKKIERLKTIIEKNIGRSLTTNEMIENIYKFKHKEDKEIQFYFYYDGKVLNLVLIDLYHLGITALKRGKDLSTIQYQKNKKNKCCLSNIVKY